MAGPDTPLQLSPVFKPKIWGRKDLAPLFSHPQSEPIPSLRTVAPHLEGPHSDSKGPPRGRQELIGEVWITDDEARILNGPLAGLSLGEASRKYGPELHGSGWKGQRFPILAKYIFTGDWLSVQVHPDDDYARTHDPGNPGKTEMWYIVRAERRAEILLALKRGVDKQSLRVTFEKENSRGVLNRFHPEAGEAIFIPPGTIHALGPGLVLFEAEQNSDLTYRLDDFGRVGLDGKPRPLHWEKGLEVLRAELPPYRDLPRLEFKESYGARRYVLACPHFAVEELTLRKLACFEGQPERVEVVSVLAGEGRVENAQGWLAYRTGDTWLIPPATGLYRLVPRRATRLLKVYVPRLDQDFRRPLARRGGRAPRIKGVIFD